MKKYFSVQEMLVTDSGLPNYTALSKDSHCFDNLMKLRLVLNVLRGLLSVPIIVNSAFRSPDVNAAVGGSVNSYHLVGRAADITCSKLPELLELCMKLKESEVLEECIYYSDKNFIHIAI